MLLTENGEYRRRLLEKDPKAWESVFERVSYLAPIKARGVPTDELIQETMITLYTRAIEKYDEKKSSINHFIDIIMQKKVLDMLRKQQKMSNREEKNYDLERRASADDNLQKIINEEEDYKEISLLRKRIQELNPRDQEIIQSTRTMTQKMQSEYFHMPLGSVKSKVSSLKKELSRKCLSNK